MEVPLGLAVLPWGRQLLLPMPPSIFQSGPSLRMSDPARCEFSLFVVSAAAYERGLL